MSNKNEERRQWSETKILDDFFVLQCVVRRLKYNQSEVFQTLCDVRERIECIVKKHVDGQLAQVHFTYHVMNALQNSRMVELFANEDWAACKEFLIEYIEPVHHLGMEFRIDYYLSEEGFWSLLKEMANTQTTIQLLFQKTNVLRYYGLYSASVLVSFEKLRRFQSFVHDNPLFIYSAFLNNSRIETSWLYLRYDPMMHHPFELEDEHDLAELYLQVYALIELQGRERKYNSKNIQLIDDIYADVVINGKKSKDKLYFSVSKNALPVDIDRALFMFKKTMLGYYHDAHIFPRNSPKTDFWHSAFYVDNKPTPILLKQRNSFQQLMWGLTLWDQVHLEKLTINKAKEIYSIEPRSDFTLKKDYDTVGCLHQS